MARRGRVLRSVAVAGPILFTIVWMTGPWWHPAYDPLRDSVSRLAVGTNGWVQTTNFVVFAILSLSLAGFLFPTLPGGRLSMLASVLLVAFSLGILGAGFFSVGTASSLHQIFSAVAFVAIILGMLVLWRDFGFSDTWRPLAAFSLVMGALSAILFLFFLVVVGSDFSGLGEWSGLFQRVFILSWTAWLQVVALRLVTTNRS